MHLQLQLLMDAFIVPLVIHVDIQVLIYWLLVGILKLICMHTSQFRFSIYDTAIMLLVIVQII